MTKPQTHRTKLPPALLLCSLLAAAAAAQAPSFRPVGTHGPGAVPPLPVPGPLSVQLVLDDNTIEGSVGVSLGAGARQFLWFNRFTTPSAFTLEEIWVLFPADPEIAAGQSIELVVFHDPDGDPSNGASHLASIATTIQVADGATFSIYALAPTVPVPAGGDVLIGVVNRFVTSGVTPESFPASLDSTSSLGRSWLATWSGDPPAPPALPSDGLLAIVDSFPGLGGNWMIRGLGTAIQPPGPATGVPSLSPIGVAALVVLLALLATFRLRRRAAR